MKKFFIRWAIEIVILAFITISLLLLPTKDDMVLFMVQCAVLIMVMIAAAILFSIEEGRLAKYIDSTKTQRKKRRRTKIDMVVDNILESVVDFPVCNAANSRVYVLFDWPFSQEYMDKEWFDKEAILYQTTDNDQVHLDGAYFIPINRIKEDD